MNIYYPIRSISLAAAIKYPNIIFFFQGFKPKFHSVPARQRFLQTARSNHVVSKNVPTTFFRAEKPAKLMISREVRSCRERRGTFVFIRPRLGCGLMTSLPNYHVVLHWSLELYDHFPVFSPLLRGGLAVIHWVKFFLWPLPSPLLPIPGLTSVRLNGRRKGGAMTINPHYTASFFHVGLSPR